MPKPKKAAEEVELYPKLQFENITICKPTLLKSQYWRFLNIDELNKKLAAASSHETVLEHTFMFPNTLIHANPLKIVFWLRNCTKDAMKLDLKRKKNCQCTPLETRVGFNQFRQMYHCPHRRLIHIQQEIMSLKPDELVAMSVISYYFLFGMHNLTYEMSINKKYLLILHFKFNIVGFDPADCIITKELLPTDITEYRRFVQPIWLQNITLQNMTFCFTSKTHGLRIINPSITVPRQSCWPLLVQYRPTDYDNDLVLNMTYETIRAKVTIKAMGSREPIIIEPNAPSLDVECTDHPYIIHPNKLSFVAEQDAKRSKMLNVHNFSQTNVEFRWQNYVIVGLLEVTFEPQIFRLKPHHNMFCIATLRSYDRPFNLYDIPAILEVHRIYDKSTRIARELLTEIESIDDPKWGESSYLDHVLLQINIKVAFKEQPADQNLNFDLPLNPDREKITQNSLFEKMYWEQLAKTNHMRYPNTMPPPDKVYYPMLLFRYRRGQAAEYAEKKMNEMLDRRGKTEGTVCSEADGKEIFQTFSKMLGLSLNRIAKEWRYVPTETTATETEIPSVLNDP